MLTIASVPVISCCIVSEFLLFQILLLLSCCCCLQKYNLLHRVTCFFRIPTVDLFWNIFFDPVWFIKTCTVRAVSYVRSKIILYEYLLGSDVKWRLESQTVVCSGLPSVTNWNLNCSMWSDIGSRKNSSLLGVNWKYWMCHYVVIDVTDST